MYKMLTYILEYTLEFREMILDFRNLDGMYFNTPSIGIMLQHGFSTEYSERPKPAAEKSGTPNSSKIIFLISSKVTWILNDMAQI